MKTGMLITLVAVAWMALLTVPADAADQKSAAQTQKTSAKIASSAWPAESLSGTIVTVDPAKRLVIVKDASGVPFDMVVNRSTRIMSGNRELKLGDLTSDANRKASVKFVPERGGDVARSIQITG
jgi:hypothetical protein